MIALASGFWSLALGARSLGKAGSVSLSLEMFALDECRTLRDYAIRQGRSSRLLSPRPIRFLVSFLPHHVSVRQMGFASLFLPA